MTYHSQNVTNPDINSRLQEIQKRNQFVSRIVILIIFIIVSLGVYAFTEGYSSLEDVSARARKLSSDIEEKNKEIVSLMAKLEQLKIEKNSIQALLDTTNFTLKKIQSEGIIVINRRILALENFKNNDLKVALKTNQQQIDLLRNNKFDSAEIKNYYTGSYISQVFAKKDTFPVFSNKLSLLSSRIDETESSYLQKLNLKANQSALDTFKISIHKENSERLIDLNHRLSGFVSGDDLDQRFDKFYKKLVADTLFNR